MEPIPLSPWLEQLAAHLPVAREGSDPEGVHQVRVAAGRLLVWLELADRRVLRDDLVWLRGSAGRLRELDVLIDSGPPRAWQPWLEGRRQRERRAFERVLDAGRLVGLLSALALLPPLDPGPAERRLERLVARAARRGGKVEREPTDIENFHRLRKSLRKVRFAKEWLGEPTKPIRAMQSSLGDLNDAWVALALLGEWPAGVTEIEYKNSLLELLDGLRRKSLQRWMKSELRG